MADALDVHDRAAVVVIGEANHHAGRRDGAEQPSLVESWQAQKLSEVLWQNLL